MSCYPLVPLGRRCSLRVIKLIASHALLLLLTLLQLGPNGRKVRPVPQGVGQGAGLQSTEATSAGPQEVNRGLSADHVCCFVRPPSTADAVCCYADRDVVVSNVRVAVVVVPNVRVAVVVVPNVRVVVVPNVRVAVVFNVKSCCIVPTVLMFAWSSWCPVVFQRYCCTNVVVGQSGIVTPGRVALVNVNVRMP